jgi:oligopeptide transport system substrate-binding protein
LERHGAPAWTRPENLVSNGPFRIESRRIRDRVRLVKNPYYWNRDQVKLNTVDILAVEGTTAMLNLYLTGAADWISDVPSSVAPRLMQSRPQEFRPTPTLGVYFYRINTRHPPLDRIEVRRALALAVDRRDIVETVTRTGQVPALSFVPPGLSGYEPSTLGAENVAEAQRLLAEAGFPGGRGFPKLEILYNTHEGHKAIAELIQDRWKRTLGIDVGLRNQEFAVSLETVRQGQYDLARAAWIGDYADPNTFLDMFVTGNENNETGWGNEEYDRLIHSAAAEADPAKRMKIFHDAEAILMRDLPILPIYFYVSKDMVRTYVHGFHHNLRDEHPLWALSVDPEEKRRVLREGITE